MYTVQRAFLRLQADLDPLAKPVPTPSALPVLPGPTTQQHKPSKRRLPTPDEAQATNRIISHVLRKVHPQGSVCMYASSFVTQHDALGFFLLL